MRRVVPYILLAVLALSAALAGHHLAPWHRTDPPHEPLPPAEADGQADVRVLLVTMWTPSTGYEHIRPFLDCLEQALAESGSPSVGSRVQLVQRNTYAEANALLATGGADMGLVCTGSTADKALRAGFLAPMRLRFDYGASYHSVVIVQAADPARDLEDLAGSELAWTDPDSLTGYRVLRAHLRSQGIDPDQYFGRATFTHSHERSVDAVRRGIVRAAAVDEEILAEVEYLEELRVVWMSEAYPSPPFLVSRDRTDLIPLLERLAERPECLEGLGANGLTATDWSAYDQVQQVIAAGH